MSSSESLSPRERDFRWQDGERLIRFGMGVVAESPALLAEHGFDGYALLSTARALGSAPGGAELAEGAACVLEVPPGGVPEAAAAVRDGVAGRPIVALGGGRVIDSAKAVAAADGLRCAGIPTTLSGAEITAIHRLPGGVERPRDGLVRPTLAIADPDVMASLARPALTATALNALAHGAEALYSPAANPVAEMAALRGARLIAAGLGGPQPDRESLALGSVLCAWAIDRSGLGLHHALCQTTVRILGTAHAETNAIMLAHVLAYVAPHAPDELDALAVALGADEPAPELAARRAAELAAAAGATGLGEVGVSRGDLDAVVDAVLERPELATTPGRPEREDITELLARAL